MPRRRLLFAAVTLIGSTSVAIGLVEAWFRVLEAREVAAVVEEGPGFEYVPDPRWGFRPSQGWFRRATHEFDVTGHVNALFMNDDPADVAADRTKTRLLALGDSFTFATGVSMHQAWPNVLERRLNDEGVGAFRVYNAGMAGYSLHQYLLRLIDQGPELRPHYVLLGVAFMNDLYDLLPPDRGGWIYGRGLARDYFDFDASGDLTERHWEPHASAVAPAAERVRELLDSSAVFRHLRHSQLALFIGSHVRIGGQSLWPSVEIVVERTVSPQHAYQWRLAEALLARIQEEAERQGARLIVVGLPYLPQVYDDVWAASFGGDPRFSRTAAAERIARWCAQRGIPYVDTLGAFRAGVATNGRWLHYRKDGHPTAEGHEVIADAILQADLIASQDMRHAAR